MKVALYIVLGVPFVMGVLTGLFPMWAIRRMFKSRVRSFNEVALVSVLSPMKPDARIESLTKVLGIVATHDIERLNRRYPYRADGWKRRFWN